KRSLVDALLFTLVAGFGARIIFDQGGGWTHPFLLTCFAAFFSAVFFALVFSVSLGRKHTLKGILFGLMVVLFAHPTFLYLSVMAEIFARHHAEAYDSTLFLLPRINVLGYVLFGGITFPLGASAGALLQWLWATKQ